MGVADSEESIVLIDELNTIERNKHVGGIIFVSVLMTMGVFGNSHVLLAYSIKVKQTPRTIFILVLGMLDLMASCIGMPFIIFLLSNPLIFDFPIACKVLRFNNYFMSAASSLTLLVVAIDRYRKICLPMSRQITKSTAKFLCLIVVVVSCMLAWPTAILYGSTSRTTRQSNITGTSCLIQQKYMDTIYPAVFYSVLLVISFIVIPCFIVLYCLIGKSIADFRKSTIEVNDTHDSGRIYTLQKHTGFRNLETRGKVSKIPTRSGSNMPTCQLSSTNVLSVSNELFKPIESTSYREDEQVKAKMQSDGTGTPMKDLYSEEQSLESNAITQGNCRHIYNESIANDKINEQNKGSACVGEIITMDNTTNTMNKDHNCVKIVIECITKHREMTSEIDGIEAMDIEDAGDISSSQNEVCDNKVIDNTGATQPVRRKYTKVHRTTFMFCLITIVLVISYIPFFILRVLALSVTGFKESMSDVQLFTYNTIYWCYYINIVVNPILYWFFDDEFRQRLKAFYWRLFCTYWRQSKT